MVQLQKIINQYGCFQIMGYERAMYFKKEAAPLDLSYFGLGGSGSKGGGSGGFGMTRSAPSSSIDDPVRVAQTNTFYQPPWFQSQQLFLRIVSCKATPFLLEFCFRLFLKTV
jgi:hypothetical protein